MAQYVCSVCGYVHDESQEGTSWDNLPGDWTCPVCDAAKSAFQRVGDEAPLRSPRESHSGGPNRSAILAHRVFGYVFLAIYLVLMFQMIPRLWTYQIEFPARTVVHLSLGMAIGTILVLKIAVVRFFRRLDQSLVPMLGTSLLVSSVVLIGISVPAAFREAAATGRLFTDQNRERVQMLLTQTGLDSSESTHLATRDSLRAGQRILRHECIDCHDLRTVLTKPRTPDNWRQTVRRMADRTTLLNPLQEDEQWLVTAYLIALSPQLHKSAKSLSDQQDRRTQARQVAGKLAAGELAAEPTEDAAYDPAASQQLFEEKCSQCHETDLVSQAPPASADEARELVAQMVDEGLEATEQELAQITHYLAQTYGQSSE